MLSIPIEFDKPSNTKEIFNLLPPVRELFHGTLYHETLLMLALPPTWHSPYVKLWLVEVGWA